MYIEVKKFENGTTKGKAYTYLTNLDLQVGDLVVAEFGNSETTLEVVSLNLPEPNFPCKEITEKVNGEQMELAVTQKAELTGIDNIVENLKINSINDLSKMQIKAETVIDELKKVLPNAEKTVVTAENYKEVKNTAKNTLSRTAKELDEIRKTPGRVFKKVKEPYEEEMKKIIDYVNGEKEIIEEKTNEFDELVRSGNLQIAREAITEAIAEKKLIPMFAEQMEIKAEYQNLNKSKKSIIEDVNDQANILALKQESYNNKLISVKFAVDQANEGLTNKLETEKYNMAIFQNVMEMGPMEELLDMVKADADKIKLMEQKAIEQKQAEIEAEARRKLEQERLLEEQRKLEQERLLETENKAKEVVNAEQPTVEQKVEEKPLEPEFKAQNTTEKKEFTYNITGTVDQMEKLLQFAKSVGVEMELIPF